MMFFINSRFCCLLFVCTVATTRALRRVNTNSNSSDVKNVTLREWLAAGEEPFNVAIVPQYNNQHLVFGIMEALKEAGLMKKLSGISACSGGTLPGAFYAAGKSFRDFDAAFPAKGWAGFGPSEPRIEKDYRAFLARNLPEKFEQLQIPLALSLTKWDDISKIKTMMPQNARPFVATSGDLHSAMVAAVATGNNGVLSDLGCPFCAFGFHPKTVEDQYPVTDGAFADIWGTKGLEKLPQANRVLHILPLDYAGQVAPQTPEDIPGNPRELVTLVAIQPPASSQSYVLDALNRRDITKRTTGEWNQMLFESNHKAIEKLLDQPFQLQRSADGNSYHGKLLVDGGLGQIETKSEKDFDDYMARGRDMFWRYYDSKKQVPKKPIDLFWKLSDFVDANAWSPLGFLNFLWPSDPNLIVPKS